MPQILGITVATDLLDAWASWLAPRLQPFFVDDAREWPQAPSGPATEISPELRDSFKVWRLRERGEIVWLDEPAFAALDRGDRRRLVRSQIDRGRGAVPSVLRWADILDPDMLRRQGDGHRFVWWPSMLGRVPELLLQRFAADEGDKTRHRSPTASTWRGCESVLPRAREIAGTFARGSGPNCFGTVMAAAGVDGAAGEWVQPPPFSTWLEAACVPGGRDEDPGTVLVWRDSTGEPVHAAVTIGNGYALEKASQTWWTPRIVGTVAEVKAASRARGNRLERHRVVAPS